MEILTSIEIVYPNTDQTFFESLESFLGESYHANGNRYPKLSMIEDDVDIPVVRFCAKDTLLREVRLENVTDVDKGNGYSYTHLNLSEIINRLDQPAVDGVDHFGFNLPWFEESIHPEIVELRKLLYEKSLYHLYPTGDSWDFILPGTPEEIDGSIPIDYNTDRRPKFEIVSFDGASTPIIQFEVNINKSFEEVSNLFPEGISIEEMHNVWLYVNNPYGIDICIVINEVGDDWSELFDGFRID